MLIARTVLAVVTTWAEDNEAAKKDKAQLQGAWTMVAGVILSSDAQGLSQEQKISRLPITTRAKTAAYSQYFSEPSADTEPSGLR